MSQRDADSNVKNILTMEQIVGEFTANSSFTATRVLSFAGLSLLRLSPFGRFSESKMAAYCCQPPPRAW
jgi:hypothetical protein